MADKEALRNFEAIQIAGNDNARGVGLCANDVAEELDAVHARHDQVEQDDIDVPLWEAVKIDYDYMNRIDRA